MNDPQTNDAIGFVERHGLLMMTSFLPAFEAAARLLERNSTALRDSSRLVTVVGYPGTGKSSIIRALLKETGLNSTPKGVLSLTGDDVVTSMIEAIRQNEFSSYASHSVNAGVLVVDGLEALFDKPVTSEQFISIVRRRLTENRPVLLSAEEVGYCGASPTALEPETLGRPPEDEGRVSTRIHQWSRLLGLGHIVCSRFPHYAIRAELARRRFRAADFSANEELVALIADRVITDMDVLNTVIDALLARSKESAKEGPDRMMTENLLAEYGRILGWYI